MKSLVNKMKNKKGFTLMEMLIVVAIMVVLVAVSIPVFTKQLDSANNSANQANERAAKSAILTDWMIDKPAYEAAEASSERYYDAATGKLVPARGTFADYGKGTNDGKVIKVEIDADSESNTYGEVTITWVD